MKIPSKINLKTALIFVGISILLTSVFFYAFASTPSSTFYISSGVYPGAPSYTIWKEGSNYFAKNANGQIDYSGTDASTVIQAAINALPNVGGTILFRVGTYSLDTKITFPVNIPIALIGEAIPFTKYVGSTIFKATSSMSAILDIVGTDGTHVAVVKIENLLLDGNSLATDGIYLERFGAGRQEVLRNVDIQYCTNAGLHIKYPIVGKKFYDVNSHHNAIGIFLEAGSNSSYHINDLRFIFVDTEANSQQGVLLRGHCEGNIFQGLLSEGNTLNELRLEAIQGAGPSLNVFHICWFEKSSVDADYVGTLLTTYGDLTSYATSANNIWDSCLFVGVDFKIEAGRDNIIMGRLPTTITICATDGYKFVGGVNQVIGVRDKYATYTITDDSGTLELGVKKLGYNSGTATISASTTVTFAHDLVGTPTGVWASFSSTGYNGWTWTATSTEITITVGTSGTYTVYWKAEYKP